MLTQSRMEVVWRAAEQALQAQGHIGAHSLP